MSREAKLSATLACGMAALALWLNLSARNEEKHLTFHTLTFEDTRTPERPEGSVGPFTSTVDVEGDVPPGAQGLTVSHRSVPADAPQANVLALEVGFQPTPEGLYERTTKLWSQEEFLDHYNAYWMWLPTLDQCRQVVEDEETLRLFQEWLWNDVVAASAAERPDYMLSADDKRVLELTRQSRDSFADQLFLRLDQQTTYKHWSDMNKNYREWIK